MTLTKLFNEFFHSEKSGGAILICCTLLSIVLSNSGLSEAYSSVWNTSLADHTLIHWINDGLMTIFFLLIGLELEREIYVGELSNIKNSSLPIIAAIGGMMCPALLHLVLNAGTPGERGAGIPMATDIAFALGVLSLLGSRVPAALKVFLTALAVIDDLGAILIIAVFYSGTIFWTNLFIAMGIFIALLIMNRLKIHNLIPYLIGGVIMWYFMLHSGVHATITGVLLAFAIPFGDGSDKSPSYILQRILHVPVAFVILPLFALANTSFSVPKDWLSSLVSQNSLGIALGLFIGKPLGIIGCSFIAIKTRISSMPRNVNFSQLLGAGFLGGIGFTMSIFITLLAFTDQAYIDESKMAIIVASLLSGIIGYIIIKATTSQVSNGTEL